MLELAAVQPKKGEKHAHSISGKKAREGKGTEEGNLALF